MGFALTLAGSISSFDSSAQATFAETVASYAGVDVSAVSLTVTSASINVDVAITIAGEDSALELEDQINNLTAATASAAFGETVETVGTATMTEVPAADDSSTNNAALATIGPALLERAT